MPFAGFTLDGPDRFVASRAVCPYKKYDKSDIQSEIGGLGVRPISRSPCHVDPSERRPPRRPKAVTTPVLDLDGRVVGRRQELAELRAAVEEAGRAGGGCTLLSGISGVGKSTLMQAFGAEISGRNCVFAYGRYQDGAAAPYSALGAALGSIVRSMEATGTAERDRWRADLVERDVGAYRHPRGAGARLGASAGRGPAGG